VWREYRIYDVKMVVHILTTVLKTVTRVDGKTRPLPLYVGLFIYLYKECLIILECSPHLDDKEISHIFLEVKKKKCNCPYA
jgi:hypothetical protein